MPGFQSQLEAWIRQACLIEVRSLKPGNVSPAAAFDDASVLDFEHSAIIRLIEPTIERAMRRSISVVPLATDSGFVTGNCRPSR